MNIITNCPLCEEKSLHVVGENESETQQCISCGYVTSTKYIGTKETNEEFQKLTDDMKSWAKEESGKIWIPSIFTLPFGMLYPYNDKDGNMKWYFAKTVEISEKEKKDYPIEGSDKFYTKKFDTENAESYDEFLFAMGRLNDIAKTIVQNKHGSKVTEEGNVKVKIPKLKKIK